LLAWLLATPLKAQDGCGDGCDDGCSVIEEDDGCSVIEDSDDKPKTPDDPGAPKVKRTFQQEINAAIERGVVWLKKKQRKDGSWGPCVGNRSYVDPNDRTERECHKSGPTTFALYTLAKCGVPKKDPAVRRGYTWLKRRYRKSQRWNTGAGDGVDAIRMTNYEVSSLILMLEAMHQRSAKLTGRHAKKRLSTKNPTKPPKGSKFSKDDWRWLHEAIDYLAARGSTRYGARTNEGLWRYWYAGNDKDLSATQFVLLGLRSASQAGYPVPPKVWIDALAGVRVFQAGKGFTYQKGGKESDGMTAAAIASMVICKEQIELLGRTVPGWLDPALKSAMARLDERFDVTRNNGEEHGGYHYYYLYTVERVGDMTGRKEFNGKDWYVRGARLLLEHQRHEGSFPDSTSMNPEDTLGTCFALLFLKRATPVAVTGSRD
jgi:hypothetical protein